MLALVVVLGCFDFAVGGGGGVGVVVGVVVLDSYSAFGVAVVVGIVGIVD